MGRAEPSPALSPRALASGRRRLGVLAAAGAVVVAVGAVDYLTGVKLRVFPLYFAPIAYVAWRSSRTTAVGFTLVPTVAWTGANWLADPHYASAAVDGFNTAMMLSSFMLVAFLVSEQQRRLQAERQLSRTDALTGLANTRSFHEHGALVLAIARRARRPLTLAYVDLDHFKTVNDRDGHEAGDRALIAVAETLRRHTRQSDFVARLGGDEFALLLTDTDADAARIALDPVRLAVAARMQQDALPITLSVGAVAFVEAPATLEQAITDADAVMYEAKAAGKNRVSIVTRSPAA